MANSQISVQLKYLKSHARFIAQNLHLKLCEALSFVALIHELETWMQLKLKHEKQTCALNSANPFSDVDSSELTLFWNLVNKYERELREAYNPKIHLSSNILTLLINKKVNSIEDHQIARFLQEFDLDNATSQDFINTIMCEDNTAYKIVKSQENGWQIDTACSKVRNLWLRSDTFNQRLYAYYYFDNKHIHIQVREWDSLTHSRISYTSLISKSWFVEMMTGYIIMLAKQLVALGYQPTFEFFKIQNVHVSNLTSEYENVNHAKHGIYILAQRLIELGGYENEDVRINKIRDDRGIKVSFFKGSFS